MKKTIALAFIAVAIFLAVSSLTGCGSGSSAAPQTGYLQGGFLSGVIYQCGDNSGFTDSFGRFTYSSGDTCLFKFGKNELEADLNALQDGVVTPYEITDTDEKAWTLMSILYSIAAGIPDTNSFVLLDKKLLTLVPEVDLSQGDTSVSLALAVFPNKELPAVRVTVADARTRLAEQVNEDGTLTSTMSEKLAAGQVYIDADAVRVGLNKRTNSDYPSSDVNKNLGETDHQNIAQFVLYDGNGCANYNYVSGLVEPASQLPPEWNWLAVADGQNPDNNVPQIGVNYTVGSCTPSSSCFGIMWDVGRSTNTSVGSAFNEYLNYSPGTPASSPMTLFADYVLQNDPNGQSSNFPNTLNLVMYMDLYLTVSDQNSVLHYYVCPNLVLAQGSNPSTPSQWLSFLKQIAQTGYAAFQIFTVQSVSIKQNLQFVNDVVGLYNDIMALIDDNWWMIGVSAQTENYYVPPVLESQGLAYWYAPAILTQCTHSLNGYGVDAVTVPILISQDTAIVNQTLSRSIFTLTMPSALPAQPDQIQSLNFFPPTGSCSESE